jgi:hypothetical protein
MAQVAAPQRQEEDWKAKLSLPPKDTRIRTEVSGHPGPKVNPSGSQADLVTPPARRT